MAPKQKGITQQTVPEVLASLIADGKIEKEKVGTQALYWSLPSQVVHKRKRERQNLGASPPPTPPNPHLLLSFSFHTHDLS